MLYLQPNSKGTEIGHSRVLIQCQEASSELELFSQPMCVLLFF